MNSPIWILLVKGKPMLGCGNCGGWYIFSSHNYFSGPQCIFKRKKSSWNLIEKTLKDCCVSRFWVCHWCSGILRVVMWNSKAHLGTFFQTHCGNFEFGFEWMFAGTFVGKATRWQRMPDTKWHPSSFVVGFSFVSDWQQLCWVLKVASVSTIECIVVIRAIHLNIAKISCTRENSWRLWLFHQTHAFSFSLKAHFYFCKEKVSILWSIRLLGNNNLFPLQRQQQWRDECRGLVAFVMSDSVKAGRLTRWREHTGAE